MPPIDFALMNPLRSARAGAPRGWPKRGSLLCDFKFYLEFALPNKKNFCYNGFMQNISPQKFFLYARKSTDVEDKQVRSIEDQITELRAYAKTEGLNIVEEFIEKQSAKIPGRPIFSEMTKRIEQGDANGILAWHPDRLARNSVDGGLLIFLLDSGNLRA